MKVLKVSLLVLLSLILVAIAAVPLLINYKRSESTHQTFHRFTESPELSFADIRWTDDTVADIPFEKTAFFVPIKIKGLSEDVYMQFDSGSSTTMLYGKTLKALGSPWPVLLSEDSSAYVEDITIEVAGAVLEARKMDVYDHMGSDSSALDSFMVVGTMGYDAFYGKTLIMDFREDKLAITEKNLDELAYKVDLVEEASVNKFPFLITAQLGENDIQLVYDTGSSMFPIVTTPHKLSTISQGIEADTLCCVSSWGVDHDVYRKKSDKAITVGKTAFNEEYVYAVPQMDHFMLNHCPDWLFFGGTGNRLFLDKIVVVDTENNQFGIAG